MSAEQESSSRPRCADLLTALSLITDLGMGNRPETAMRGCLIATNLARRLQLDDRSVAEVYYTTLLRYVGCTAPAHDQAFLFGGDDVGLRARSCIPALIAALAAVCESVRSGKTNSAAALPLVTSHVLQTIIRSIPIDRSVSLRSSAWPLTTLPFTPPSNSLMHWWSAVRLRRSSRIALRPMHAD